jgi:hypothetical protein
MGKLDTTQRLQLLKFIKVVLGRHLALCQHQALLIWLLRVEVEVVQPLHPPALVAEVGVLADLEQEHFLLAQVRL